MNIKKIRRAPTEIPSKLQNIPESVSSRQYI